MAAATNAWTGRLAGPRAYGASGRSGLGLPLSTYTAALITDTAVPVWHQARWPLPFVFGSGAALTAGAAAVAVTPPRRLGRRDGWHSPLRWSRSPPTRR